MTDAPPDRMNRNATALVASSAITAALGLLFWVVAANVSTTTEVGTGTAIVTSIVLLGNLATLGLRNGLIRFMTAAGEQAGRFIASAYLLCATVAIVVAAAFAFGTPWWAQELTMLRSDLVTGLAFALGAAVWTVFVLQDNVLTGLRHAVWVPIENLAYSVLKLGLLAALVATGAWALPLAWCVPALAMIVPVNLLIYRRLLPEHRRVEPSELIFSRSAIARFSMGDFGSDLVRMLGVEVVVLVVLGMRGAEDTAYVFFAITIAATGQLISNNIVTAFVAEAAARPTAASDLARRAGVNIARLIVPGALIGALAAPLVLGALGGAYADNGTTLLRLLVLDSIPLAVAALATGWARFERAVGVMVAISLGVAVAPLFGAVVLAPTWGLDVIGWSALIGHSLLAAWLLATTLRPVWQGGHGGLIGWLLARRRAIRQRRRTSVVATVLDELDATRPGQHPLEPRWLIPSENDTAIVMVDHPESARVVKIALSDNAAAGLRHHAEALADLGATAAGSPIARLLPAVVDTPQCAGHQLVIETACRGHRPLAADHDTLVAVARAVADVHSLSAAGRDIGGAEIAELVTEPVNVLSADQRLWPLLAEINALYSLLVPALSGRRLVTARTHGDCWLGNTLVERGEDGLAVTGLIDWEDSRPHGLPDADLAHLWLTAQGGDIGRVAVDALSSERPVPVFSDLGVDAPNPELPVEVGVLLAWLEHVAAGLSRSSRFALGRLWLANNVEPVLRSVNSLDTTRWAGRHGYAGVGADEGAVAHGR